MGSPLYLSISISLLNLLLLFFLVSSVRPLCHPDERSALLQFKESFFSGQIPSEILELSELELLDLSGNSLKLGKTGFSSLLEKLTKLQGLYLTDVRISSSLPNMLANFSSLKALILSNCDLRGEFPTGIFELPALQFLNLQSNPKLTGYLPDIQSNHPLSELSLANTNFFGQLPESFGNFKSLELLDINNCHFSGKLPCSLANLTQLVYVCLATNNFDRGTLSWLGTQINLTHLDLANTGLSGKIPSTLKNLTQITLLYLWSNRLEGQIPPWIGNLTKLTKIAFEGNILSGPIPESIFKLENLELLFLQDNQLNGILKLDSFLELKNLTGLQLTGNNLSLLNTVGINATAPKFKILGLGSCDLSEFPDFLRSQDELEFLTLDDNNIHGQIPKWFLRVGKETLWCLNLGFNFLTRFEEFPVVLPWTSLEFFSLKSNMFRGPLPHPPPSIVYYDFSNNSLSEEIPPILYNLSFLVALDLSDNNLTGMLPRCLVNLSDSLQVLNLRNNHFAGAIPSTYTKSCGLRMMDLSQNQLKGRIPRSLAHCTKLEFLNLGNNLINDTFPSWLGTLPELKVLILRANGLHGVIGKPQAKLEFSKLQVIDLSDNSLRGKLPSEYFNIWVAMELANTNSLSPYMNANTSFQTTEYEWSNYYNYVVTLANKDRDLRYEKVPDSISAIDWSSNQFQGEIPEVIGNLKLIRMLNLSNNNITGHIPSSLGEIMNLESLDLSRNKLSGQIPQQLANINFLEVFKVSYNNLEGPIPRGPQFDTFNNDSYEGNSRLCGYPLSKNCGNPEVLQPPPSLISKEDGGIESSLKFGWKIVLTGYGVGLIIGLSHGYNFTSRKHEWFIKVVRKWQ
ncbi:Leucine-rich repeat - like 10, partial [Theobroma cacao]